ncbi:hypothetical protein CU098_009012 [Rhizopus stolonifer]|uniref:PDEase domain-containing protein n=2 Tax=Mucorineae TaxID=1344963 RepID=A0A367J1A2_RHIST|nr:hypothetical protein CU098_009012 [Rhizopus stolonifer]
MDRYKANPSKINVGFIDFIVRPYFESLCQLFTKANELIVRCDQNREEWLHLAWEKPPDPKDTHLPSIEESLGGSIEEQVMTVAPGSVNIPSSIEQDIRQRIIQLNRSISFNDQHLVSQCREWLLSPSKEEKEREMEALRRNSEGMTATLCHTLPGFSQLHKAFYSRRRKSEEVSHRLNASGMKNKMTTATGMTTTT